MKNSLTMTAALAALVFVTLGCGLIGRYTEPANSGTSSNKTLEDRAVDVAVGEEKIGVTECDEVMEMLVREANSADDNFVTKAVKATFLNKVRESLRRSIEENRTDTAELAKTCAELRTQLEKYKAEEQANQAK